MHFAPGMIFDDLRPGEDIGTINSTRPNPNAVTWCDLQMRAVSAGADVSNSSATKNYDGTYSAQRQELVEQWGAYAVLQQAFIDQFTAEVYPRFVAACLAAGIVKPKRGGTFAQLSHALYTAPVMPWIDPVKEVTAWQMLEDRGWVAGSEIVRQRGRNPRDTIRAQAKWQQDLRDAGVITQDAPTSQPTYKKQPPPADESPEAPDNEQTPTTKTSGAAGGVPSAAQIARAAVIQEAFHA
jgi:lambda family phage portal protein